MTPHTQRRLKVPRPPLTLRRVRECLSYDSETGLLTWIKPTGKRIRVGFPAGSPSDTGHVIIQIDGWSIGAHVLAWWMTYGRYPHHEIDHRDGEPGNNRKRNLRKASRNQQGANSAKQRRTTSSRHKGVTWDPRRACWVAQIHVNGRHIHLGQHKQEDRAAMAYDAAALSYFGAFARPNFNQGAAL